MLKKEYQEFKKRVHEARKLAILNFINTFDIRTQAELASMVGIDVRSVRALIQELRFDGEPICGGDEGYWIAKDAGELTHTINIFRMRIKTSVDVMFALEQTQKTMKKAENDLVW
jgi:biotin operon repressor